MRLDHSTLADWVGRATRHLRPVHERLLEHIRASTNIFADETRAPVLDPGRGRNKTGQLWAYARALISQKTKLAEAIRYTLSRWDGLSRFLDDGRVGIDSNVVERAIRPIALNR